ncbi:helix-turn-helix domain-containing protein [Bacillus sp. 31A1R]|uniref:Helix-turn-helix domain-containing protein n=1 Tax=Robertmurraya mangrovi TaxID=3098077 RepID=A0ABU5IVY8_9BACI|nr:helix-turn-helix domain-containing protein [Bacillus sp. 31A1R]MDZ5471305.1 helix-turn-helix domain-containing protein [Bacillus sp. 31A1R]
MTNFKQEDTFEVTSLEKMKALSHPLRQRILASLRDQVPKTSQQLSLKIGEPRNKVHYHIQQLHKAGLLVITETKIKGNFTEKYYLPIANKIIYKLEEDSINDEMKHSELQMNEALLNEHKELYLQAIEDFFCQKSNSKPLLIGLNKELSKEQVLEFKKDIEALLEKWYQTDAKGNELNFWELAVMLYPINRN